LPRPRLNRRRQVNSVVVDNNREAILAAIQMMESGDAAGAEKHFKKILKSKPKNLDANINLAILYAQQAQFGRALRHLRTVVAQNDKIALAHHLTGDCLLGLRKPEESARAYQRAVNIDTKLSDCWFNLGLMRREIKELDSAVAAFKKVIELAPDFSKAHEQMGLTLIETGNYREGLAALAKGTGFIAFDNKGSGPYRIVTSLTTLRNADK